MCRLFYLGVVCWLATVSRAQNLYPIGREKSCSLLYDDAFAYGRQSPKHNWVCEDSQYTSNPYPETQINSLLMQDKYMDFKYFLDLTKQCMDFNADQAILYSGDNVYYKWESMCKMKRYPVTMIWAKPDNVVVPQQHMGINNGYLPVYVLQGQNLFNVECVHPWSDGVKFDDPRLTRRLSRIKWTGTKRHLCLYGYLYNNKHVCKPSGFMTRYVLVYSPHLEIIFKARVDDVPTSCVCATCDCTSMSPVPVV